MTDLSVVVDGEDTVFVDAIDEAMEQVYIPTEDEINAYFIKYFNYLKDCDIPGVLTLSVKTAAHNSANTLEINYEVTVGDYGKQHTVKSSSFGISAMTAKNRYWDDRNLDVKQIPVF